VGLSLAVAEIFCKILAKLPIGVALLGVAGSMLPAAFSVRVLLSAKTPVGFCFTMLSFVGCLVFVGPFFLFALGSLSAATVGFSGIILPTLGACLCAETRGPVVGIVAAGPFVTPAATPFPPHGTAVFPFSVNKAVIVSFATSGLRCEYYRRIFFWLGHLLTFF